MLFLGIDQHARQLTVSLRDQSGDVVLARQVSIQPEKILEFFDQWSFPQIIVHPLRRPIDFP